MTPSLYGKNDCICNMRNMRVVEDINCFMTKVINMCYQTSGIYICIFVLLLKCRTYVIFIRLMYICAKFAAGTILGMLF